MFFFGGWFWLNMDWDFYSWKTYNILLNGFCCCQRLLGIDPWFLRGVASRIFPILHSWKRRRHSGMETWMKSSQERNSNNCFVTFKSRGRVFVRAFLKLLGVWGATSLEWTLRCCFVNPLPKLCSKWKQILLRRSNQKSCVLEYLYDVLSFFNSNHVFEANSSCYEVLS